MGNTSPEVGEEGAGPTRAAAPSLEEGPGEEGAINAGTDGPSRGVPSPRPKKGGSPEGIKAARAEREDGRRGGLRPEDRQGVAQGTRPAVLEVDGPNQVSDGLACAIIPVEPKRAYPEGPATALPAWA